jgi:hypothetical protein
MDPLGEKLPYVVTLLFAAIGWGVTHTVDRVLKAPIIEYRTQVVPGPDAETSVFIAKLRNLSHDRVYGKIAVVFLLPASSHGKFTYARVDATPPAWEGRAQPKWEGRSVRFNLPALYPAGELALSAHYTGDSAPLLRLAEAENALRLTGPSLETFLVDHEITIIVCAISLWAVLLLFLVVRRSPRKTVSPPP